MALFRQTSISYHRPAPAGKPYGPKCSKAEATDEHGKRRPGYKRKETKSTNYYGQFRDHAGEVQRVPLCPDKTAAKQLLAKIITEDRMIGAGLTDANADQKARPLAEHIAEYLKYLLAKGDTAPYVAATGSHIRGVVQGCGFKLIADLNPGRVMEYLAERRQQGLSASASNHYLRAVKGFSTWLVKSKRSREDVLKFLSAMNTEADRRHVRRAVSAEEFAALVEAARKGETFRGLDGPSRRVLYLLAAGTGYRVSELASVTPGSFNLGGKPPTLTVAAGYSKRRRRDEVPLTPSLVPMLREFLKGRPADEPVFSGWWMEKAAEMVRGDLQAARAAWIAEATDKAERDRREASDSFKYRDSAGHVFDFHALRGQFITFLARAGVGLTTAQKLARHSTPTLTANVYTHLGLSDLAAAVEGVALPIDGLHSPAKSPPLRLTLANVG